MEAGSKVKLITFNGKSKSKRVDASQNYWRLIGQEGTILQDPNEKSLFASFSKKPRVLIKFDIDVVAMGLIAHNPIPNSLWILVTDLERS
jgi:hypothetical protein